MKPAKPVDQLRGVQQIHPTETDFVYTLPSFLSYGSYGPALPYGCRGPSPPRCPYPPRRKSTVKPSMAPHLKAVEDKPSCQQGGWNGEDWKDWNEWSEWSQDWTLNLWNSKENEEEDSHEPEQTIKRSRDRGDEVPILQGGWNGEDWTDWNEWSEWSQDWTWNLWNSKENREEDSHELEQTIKRSRDRGDEVPILQGGWNGEDWTDWNEGSEWSQDWTWNLWNSKENKEEDSHELEQTIKRSREILQRHRGDNVPIVRSGKRGRSPLLQEEPYSSPKVPKELRRQGQGSKASKHAKAIKTKWDDMSAVEVGELLYSQESVKSEFRCGRSVSQLVQALLDGKVSLDAPFLRLTVFETASRKKGTVLRCIDNRRLYALKEYAKRSGKHRLMVNIDFYSKNTLKQVRRFMQNSDNTDGRDVRVRGR